MSDKRLGRPRKHAAINDKNEHIGTMTRYANLGRRKADIIAAIQQRQPSFDGVDAMQFWTLGELDELFHEFDIADQIEALQADHDRLPVEQPNGQITVAAKSRPEDRIYSPAALPELPSESVKTVVVLLTKLSREEVADVCRILKPGGNVTLRACRDELPPTTTPSV